MYAENVRVSANFSCLFSSSMLQDMLGLMNNSIAKPHSLQRSAAEGWSRLEAIQKKIRRVSEMDHKCMPMSELANWKAFDYYNFTLSDMAMLLCDDNSYLDAEIFEVWTHFSNACYLLLHGRMNERILAAAEQEVKLFAEKFKKKFGPQHCTWKFHVFQHFPQLVRLHGPAFLWDDFMYERLLGYLGEDVTSTNVQVLQATRNFMLRHHAEYFMDSAKYVDSCREFIESLGVSARDASLTKLVVEPINFAVGAQRAIDPALINKCRVDVIAALKMDPDVFERTRMERVTRLRR